MHRQSKVKLANQKKIQKLLTYALIISFVLGLLIGWALYNLRTYDERDAATGLAYYLLLLGAFITTPVVLAVDGLLALLLAKSHNKAHIRIAAYVLSLVCAIGVVVTVWCIVTQAL